MNIPALESLKSPCRTKVKKTAILGCGLAGLAAAWDLPLKGYKVLLVYHGEQPGDFLREKYQRKLSAHLSAELFFQCLDECLERLQELGVEFAPCDPLVSLTDLRAKHDAIFVDVQACSELRPKENIDECTGCLAADYTLAFGGFSTSSAMQTFEGRRGASTLIRMLGRSSPVALREQEGPQQSNLFVDLSDIKHLARSSGLKQTGLDQAGAISEAGRCLQCTCHYCIQSCAYLQHYEGTPKANARKMFVNLGIFTGYRHANKQINSCTLCGQCEVLCPNAFSMGELCLLIRKKMVTQGKMPPSAHDFALRELKNSTASGATLVLGASPGKGCTDVFFPGCQLAASRPAQTRFMF